MSSYDYIKQWLIEKRDVKPEAIGRETKLTDPGLDSLSIADLMFDVTDKYGIDIPHNRASVTTLGEGAEIVDELVRPNGSDTTAAGRRGVFITATGLVLPHGGDSDDVFDRLYAGESAVRKLCSGRRGRAANRRF